MLFRIVAWLDMIVAIVGIVLTFRPEQKPITVVEGLLIGMFIAGLIAVIMIDIREYLKNRPKSFKHSDQIEDYMFNWISKGSQVAIFTHDMTWANTEVIQELLAAKARRDELSIYLPKPIELTDELEGFGARIISYEHLNFWPAPKVCTTC